MQSFTHTCKILILKGKFIYNKYSNTFATLLRTIEWINYVQLISMTIYAQ